MICFCLNEYVLIENILGGLCFGVSILCFWRLMYVIIFLVKFSSLSGHLLGK